MSSKISVALAIITNERNEILVLRKKGGSFCTLPGGKIESGETPIGALIRELREELDVIFDPDDFDLIGTHVSSAANESNTTVEGYIFNLKYALKIEVSAHAEIEDVIWLCKSNYTDYNLANILKEFAIPRWLS